MTLTITKSEVPLGLHLGEVTFSVDCRVSRDRADGHEHNGAWVDREWVEAEVTSVTVQHIEVFDDEGEPVDVTEMHRNMACEWFLENCGDEAIETAEGR